MGDLVIVILPRPLPSVAVRRIVHVDRPPLVPVHFDVAMDGRPLRRQVIDHVRRGILANAEDDVPGISGRAQAPHEGLLLVEAPVGGHGKDRRVGRPPGGGRRGG